MSEEGKNPAKEAEDQSAASSEQSTNGESDQHQSSQKDTLATSKYVGEGKTFQSYEELENAYGTLNTDLVEKGTKINDLERKAAVISALAEKAGISEEEALNRLQQATGGVSQEASTTNTNNTEVTKLKSEVESLRTDREVDKFVAQNPQAVEFADELRNMRNANQKFSVKEHFEKTFGKAMAIAQRRYDKEIEDKERNNVSTGEGSGIQLTDTQKKARDKFLSANDQTTREKAALDVVSDRLFGGNG